MAHLHELLTETLTLLRRMEEILALEGERNWIRGIGAAIAEGEAVEKGGDDAVVVFDRMASTYRSMVEGPGGFGDYFIWREDLKERRRANEEFKAISEKLWALLGR